MSFQGRFLVERNMFLPKKQPRNGRSFQQEMVVSLWFLALGWIEKQSKKKFKNIKRIKNKPLQIKIQLWAHSSLTQISFEPFLQKALVS